MIVTITSNSSPEEIEQALQLLEADMQKHASAFDSTFNAFDHCGVIQLKEDSVQMQKLWRDEWA